VKFLAVIGIALGLHGLMFVGLGKLGKRNVPTVAQTAPVPAPLKAAEPVVADEPEGSGEAVVPAASIAGAFARKPAKRVRPVSAPRVVEKTAESAEAQPLPVFEVNTGSENVEAPPVK
jgi:hypothetical protein